MHTWVAKESAVYKSVHSGLQSSRATVFGTGRALAKHMHVCMCTWDMHLCMCL